MRTTDRLRPGQFRPGEGLQTFTGYSDGQRWKGWACPYFTAEEAQNIVALWNNAGIPAMQARYDAVTDTFRFMDEGMDEPVTFAGATVELDGEHVTLYPIGNGFWCWSAAEEA